MALAGAGALRRMSATYHAATRAREIVRSTPAYTVSDADDLMAGSLGLDLDITKPVPPFFPVLRNEDGLFGSHLRLTAPDARLGFCPIALLHAPPDVRVNAADAKTRGAGRLSCVDLVLLGLATAHFLAMVGQNIYPAIFVLYAGYRYGWDERAVGLCLAAVGVSSIVVQVVFSAAVGARPSDLEKISATKAVLLRLAR